MSTATFFIQKLTLMAFLSLATFGYTNSATAAILNGNFIQGLDRWQSSGDVSVQNSNQGLNQPGFHALLTNASAKRRDDFPARTGAMNFSGNEPIFVDFGNDPLEDFLGTSRGSLPENSTQASAIKQEITVKAGDVLEFDWNFLTNERSSDYRDYAFVWLNGFKELTNTSATFLPSATPFARETGFQTFSYTFATTGTYTLGLGVVDSMDLDVSSALMVKNVRLTSLVSVPEPGSQVSLILLGIVSLVTVRQQEAR